MPLVNNYRGPMVAPHNAYRTHPGEYNDWCVIVCHSDNEWARLVQVMGGPSWATMPKFATLADDCSIKGNWTSTSKRGA